MKHYTLLIALIIIACTPLQQQKVKTVEIDLCKARETVKALEDIDPALAPAVGSPRDKIERAEDSLCATIQ